MFRSSSKKSTSINAEKIDTFIGKNTTFEGTINAEGTIRIDGRIIGEVGISGNLIIGECAYIKGNVKADSIHMAGSIEGNVVADSQLHITSSSKIWGDITVRSVVMDEGAIFIGNCKMIAAETAVTKIEKEIPLVLETPVQQETIMHEEIALTLEKGDEAQAFDMSILDIPDEKSSKKRSK